MCVCVDILPFSRSPRKWGHFPLLSPVHRTGHPEAGTLIPVPDTNALPLLLMLLGASLAK